ncbi:hypothetical protein ACHAXS_011878 [Conticribra weissflogii]
MRRTGSSCLLRPRNSLSTEDLQRLAQDPPTATVLTSSRLPTYCSDRDYILSELQVHAHSIRFLCDLQNNGDIESRAECLPSSVILYMLWKPNTYPTPRSFADGPLSESVRQCLLINGDSVPEEELEHVRSNPRSSPYSPRRQTSPLIQEQLKRNCSLQYDGEDRNFEVVADSTHAETDKGKKDKFESSSEEVQREDLSSDDDEDKGTSSTTPPSSPTPPTKKKYSDREQLTKIYVIVDRLSNYESKEPFPGLGELPNLPDLNCSSQDEGRSYNVDCVDSHLSGQSNKDVFMIRTRNEDGIQSQQQQREKKESLEVENQTNKQKEQKLLNQHNQDNQTAESLARAVASSRFLRNRIDGITVGITSDARAAPGLEACLNAVERGAKERRQVAKGVTWSLKSSYGRKKKKQLKHDERMMMDLQNGPVLVTSSSWDEGLNENDGKICTNLAIGDDKMQEFLRKRNFLQSIRDRSPKCSPVAIITCQPDDLEGMNHGHHHNHSHHNPLTHAGPSQKILQSRICAEWNGKGDFKTFSDRAMKDWRTVWCPGVMDDYSTNASSNVNSGRSGWTNNIGRKKPRVPRISGNGADYECFDECDLDEPLSTVMVTAFLVCVVAYVWNHYGDHILGAAFGIIM